MATITVTKRSVSAKSGVVCYKETNQRGTGAIYFMPGMFVEGQIPETITLSVDGDQFAIPAPPKPRKAKAVKPEVEESHAVVVEANA